MELVMVYYHMINKLFNPLHEHKKYPDVTCDKDIVYNAKYEICKADIFYKGDKNIKRPLFINVHGGGFVSGDKFNRRHFCSEMAERGYFVYSPNYRLASTDPFPAFLEDIIDAINFIEELKEIYPIDCDRIVLSGDSAGAFIAAQVYATMKNDDYRKQLGLQKVIPDIKVLVPFCGPYNILDFIFKPSPFGVNHRTAEMIAGMKLERRGKNAKDYKYYDELSVTNYINADWNNVFLVYAKKDYFCKGSGEKLKDLLDSLKVNYGSFSSKRLIDNHCFHLILFTKISKRCLDNMDAFIKNCFDKDVNVSNPID